MDSPEQRLAEDPGERSRYDLMRVKHGILSIVSIPRKLRWCGYLSAIAALPTPIVLAVPDEVRETYLTAYPATAPLALVTIVLLGTACLLLATLGLTWIGSRATADEDLPEDRIWRLIGAEDAFTGIAFITGGLAVVSGVGLLASGLGGPEAVAWLDANGIEPYLVVPGMSVPPLVGTIASIAVAAIAFGCSRWLRRG